MQEEEGNISCTAGSEQTGVNEKDKYDLKDAERSVWRVAAEHTDRGTHRFVDAYLYQHKCTRHRSVFTFLQTLMEEAMEVSELPPSTSKDSEASNMADDWKLLQDKGAQNWLCQSVFSSSAQHSPFYKSRISKDWLSPLWPEQPIRCHTDSCHRAAPDFHWSSQTELFHDSLLNTLFWPQFVF